MRTSSAKAKGRRACAEVKVALHEAYPHLSQDDIVVTPSGVTGEDLHLSPLAREGFNFAIECKNQEALNIWASLDQAQYHATKRPGSIPLLVFRRNRSKLYCALEFKHFLELMKRG